jgi:hypothetical protein
MELTPDEKALKCLWLSAIGTDAEKLPPEYQWGMWLRAFGPHAAQAILRTSKKQHGMLKFQGVAMEPQQLWRFCNGTARQMAEMAGYVRADLVAWQDRSKFQAPAEWVKP